MPLVFILMSWIKLSCLCIVGKAPSRQLLPAPHRKFETIPMGKNVFCYLFHLFPFVRRHIPIIKLLLSYFFSFGPNINQMNSCERIIRGCCFLHSHYCFMHFPCLSRMQTRKPWEMQEVIVELHEVGLTIRLLVKKMMGYEIQNRMGGPKGLSKD